MRHIRLIVCTAALLACLGCHASPNIEIVGSYFPAWMLSLISGVAVAVALHLTARWRGFEGRLEPAVLVYTSITIIVTCILWLAVFA